MKITNAASPAVNPSKLSSTQSPVEGAASPSKAPSVSAEVKFGLNVSFALDGFDAAHGAHAGQAGQGAPVGQAGQAAEAGLDQELAGLAQELLNMLSELGLDEGADAASSSSAASSDSSAGTGGLQKNPEGWPAGSVRTPGGYTVVPEGKDAAFSVFGPGQSPSDTPTSRVWGDPHVKEADGTKWDFTKDSNFRLPDGTTLAVDTTSEKGQSVTQGVSIVNGNEHVGISGINTDKPSTGEIGQVPAEVKARMAQAQDTFSLDHSGSEVQWFRSRAGKIEGLVTGSKQDAEKTYDQVLDANAVPVSRRGAGPANPAIAPENPGVTQANQAAATAAPLGSDDFEKQLMDELGKLLEAEGQDPKAAPQQKAGATDELGEVKELLAAIKQLAKLLEQLAAPQRPTAVAA